LYFCIFSLALQQVPTAHAGRTHGFCVRRGDVKTWSFVLLFKFSTGRQFSAPKPARTQSPKSLCVMQKKLTCNIDTIELKGSEKSL